MQREKDKKTFLIMVVELALVFFSALGATVLRLFMDDVRLGNYDPYFFKTAVLATTYVTVYYMFNLYTADMYKPSRNMTMRLLQATIVATVVLFSLFYIVPELKTWRGILLINTIFLPITMVLWRHIASRIFKVELPLKRVLIMGSGELAKKIGAEIYHKNEHGLKLVGFIDDDPDNLGKSIVNPGVIGGYGDISRLSRVESIDFIIVALADRRAKLPMSALLDCKLRGIHVEEGETFNERVTGKIPLDHLKPSWMVFSDGFKSLRSRKLLKRSLDLLFSFILLVVAAPIMLLTAIIIKLESKGPVIFKQVRVGENDREFNIYKFRSMRQDAESATGPVWAGSGDNRATRVGRIIRLIRVDELPQLINVIKGDMSFVGPRPERPFFVSKLKEVIPYYEMRHVVKPGITGWAQVKYPYGSTVQDALEKLQYDIYYIKNMSPILDMVVFFSTIKVVLTGKGAR